MPTATEILTAAGHTVRPARYRGECEGCHCERDATDLRIVRGGTRIVRGAVVTQSTWAPICKRVKCAEAYLAGVYATAPAGLTRVSGGDIATDHGYDALDRDDIAARAMGYST